MERRAIDDRAARLAEVQSELTEQLTPVRGNMSDEQFARALTLFSKNRMRAQRDPRQELR